MRCGIVDPNTMICRNAIVWDGAAWLPPPGYLIIEHPLANVGWTWDAQQNTFIPPAPPEE